MICVPVSCETVHPRSLRSFFQSDFRASTKSSFEKLRVNCGISISEMGFFGNTLYRSSQNVLSYVVMKTTWIGFENIREAVVRQAQSACGMEGSVKNKRDRLFFTQLFVPQASQSS